MSHLLYQLLFHAWVASGSLDAATYVAQGCATPTSWVEQDSEDHEFWFAVCGTADYRVCGEDVPWISKECEPKEQP